MPDRVTQACEDNFDAHKSDCSGFARAVAAELKVTLNGLADQIVDTIRAGGDWRPLADGVAAAASAHNGKLVIAGLKGAEQTNPDPHGHVVVVVDAGRWPATLIKRLLGQARRRWRQGPDPQFRLERGRSRQDFLRRTRHLKHLDPKRTTGLTGAQLKGNIPCRQPFISRPTGL